MSLGFRTIRGRLILAVLLPALLIIALSAALDFRTASRFAQREQDALLLRTAVAFAGYLNPDSSHNSLSELIRRLHSRSVRLLDVADGDTIRFLIVDEAGDTLAGDPQMRSLLGKIGDSSPTKPVFLDATLDGEKNRIVGFHYTARGFSLSLLVAETSRARDAAIKALVLDSVWPNLLLVVVMLLALGIGIQRSLRRLDAIGREISEREATDLDPIAIEPAPVEIRPLLEAFNQMLARITKANREQRTFLSGAAHQLRTPLAGIQMQVDLALSESPKELKPRLQRVHAAIGDLVHCTHQMLALARSSSAASDNVELGRVELVDLIEDASSNWVDLALQRDVELVFRLEPASCLGSPWMLQQLLGNLIDNAIKHGPPKGVVIVGCGVDAMGRAFMEVADEGPGIPPEARRTLLEPFVRGAETTSDGAGLGLAIVHEVVERHNATLEFRLSKTPSRATPDGSTVEGNQPVHRVRVTFPRTG